jgi:hypothetical protein
MTRSILATCALAASLVFAPGQSAAQTPAEGLAVAVSGTVNKQPARGTLTIKEFEQVGSTVYANGLMTLVTQTGKARTVVTPVSVPLVLPAAAAGNRASSVSDSVEMAAAAQQAATCDSQPDARAT